MDSQYPEGGNQAPGAGLPPSPLPLLERYALPPGTFVLLILLFLMFHMLFYQVAGGLITFLLFGLKPSGESVFGLRLVNGVGEIVFLLIPALLLVRLVTRTPGQFLAVRLPGVRPLLIPLVGIFSLEQMIQVYMTFQDRLQFPEPVQSEVDQLRKLIDDTLKLLVGSGSFHEFLWVVFVVSLIPAVAEELFFRGLIMRSFQRVLPPRWSVVLTGFVFAVYHLNPFSFVPLAALGIYLGFITMRAGSIWVSVWAHFCNNFIACLATYLNIGDDNVLVGHTGDMSTAALLLTFWFFGLIFILSTYYFIVITKPVVRTEGSE